MLVDVLLMNQARLDKNVSSETEDKELAVMNLNRK